MKISCLIVVKTIVGAVRCVFNRQVSWEDCHASCHKNYRFCFSNEPFELVQHEGCEGSLLKLLAEDLMC
jgi:hypothetical protein